jgi:hypothetical protein
MFGSLRDKAPLLLLLLGPLLLFPGALPGPRVVSADDHLSVHVAYQEAAGGRVRHPHLSDPALQFEPLRRVVQRSLRRGEAPLWNPDLYGGAPLLADAQSMPASPVTLAHLAFEEDTAQDVGVAWVLLFTGLGAALLCRRLGVGPGAAALAGLAAMTGPFPMVWLLHPQAATFAWAPWLLLAIEAASPVGAALSTFGLLTGGHPGTAAHVLGLGAGWWALRSRRGAPLIGLLVGALLSAPLTAPFLSEALRSSTAAERGGNQLEPRQLLDLLWPGWLGHPARDDWAGPGSWADGQLHPGLGALALALFGGRRALGLWLGWALLVLFALTGLPGPINHARLGGEAALLLALAAGLGADRLPQKALPVVLFGLLATGVWARRDDQGSLPPEAHAPAPAAWTARLGAAVGADGPDAGRVIGLGWMLQPNTGSLVGLRDLRGYDLPVSVETHRLMTALNPRPRGPWYPIDTLPPRPLLDFAAVRAVISEAPLEGLEPIEVGPAPVAVSALDPDAPRAWLAPSTRAVTSAEAALAAISADPEARAHPPVEGLPARGGEGPFLPLSLREEGDARLTLTLPEHAPGLIVVADAWAPGWRARVDGAPAAVLRVGGAFRGVWAGAEAKEIELYYRPDAWILGCRLGALGALGLLALLAARLRRALSGRRAP